MRIVIVLLLCLSQLGCQSEGNYSNLPVNRGGGDHGR
jgi:hypothetical protein